MVAEGLSRSAGSPTKQGMAPSPSAIPAWSWLFPLAAAPLLLFGGAGGWMALPMVLALGGTVFASVHHAEVVAARVGEPFGTLILAVAVTVIEVALIVSLMLSDPVGQAALPRDTVFAAVMIVCNLLVGLCLLVGGARHHEQGFQARSASAFLSVIVVLATLVLVLPNHTTSGAEAELSRSQMLFVGVAALGMWLVFVFVQTLRHRDYFLPDDDSEGAHAAPPTPRATLVALGLLVASLGLVVLMAKALTPTMTAGLAVVGAPVAAVGVIIAALILMPESVAALRAARANRLQTALNLALGSVLACIGLTVPIVVGVALVTGQPVILGLSPSGTVLLAVTFLVSVLTLGAGRTTVLQGAVHLTLGLTWLFLVFVP
jgi:Ca2+:H+ antiporter